MMVAPPVGSVHEPGVRRWAGGLRLLLVSAAAAALYAGGVYWIRSRITVEPAGRGSGPVVQVQLLPRPSSASVSHDFEPPPRIDDPAGDVGLQANASGKVTSDPAATASVTTLADLGTAGARPAGALIAPPPVGVTARFQQMLLDRVARFQKFPRAARHDRLHGTVDALFSMRRDGTVLGAWVHTSSGWPILDREALAAIRRAQPLPAIPPELPDRLNISVTLVFDPS